MIKYYPLTRIKQNQYTRGGEFQLPNGTFYAGRYYLTYDGKAYTGINPVLGSNEPLKASSTNTNTTVAKASYANASTSGAQKEIPQSDLELTELAPYYPEPLSNDYTRGYFTRYFAKNVSGPGFVLEISKLDWTKIQNGNVAANTLGYQTMDMLWQLTGPLNDKRISQYQIQGGIIETNKRITEAKNKGFNGIVAYIGDEYTKYSKPTP